MSTLAQRQKLREKIHAATTPGYNTTISCDGSNMPKIDTAALIIARDYPVPPREGTPEHKTYTRLLAASAEWRERSKASIMAAEAQREWTESEDYRTAAEALNVARKFISDAGVLAQLELALETASLGTLYATLGSLADEHREKRNAELEALKQQQAELKLKAVEAEMDSANLEVIHKLAEQARGVSNEQETQ